MGNSNNGNRSTVDQEIGRVSSEYGNLNNFALGGNSDFGQGNANDLRSRLLSMYGGDNSSSSVNPNTMKGIGSGGNTYGGDVNFNPATLGNYGSAREGYEDFAKSGGVDATAMRRANTLIPSFYDAYKRNASKRAGIQGGYAPGFDAQMAEVGRQAGREGFNSARETEGDIARLTQSGRLAGLSGLTGLGNTETGLNQFNTGLGAQIAEGNANRRQSANQFGANQDLDWARFGEDTRRYDQGFNEDKRRFGIGGIQGLYDTDNSNVGRNMSAYLSGIGGRSNNTQNLIYNRTEPTSRAGSLLGGAANLGLGLIGMGGPRRRINSSGPWEAGGGG